MFNSSDWPFWHIFFISISLDLSTDLFNPKNGGSTSFRQRSESHIFSLDLFDFYIHLEKTERENKAVTIKKTLLFIKLYETVSWL